jgi:uncharacterized protein
MNRRFHFKYIAYLVLAMMFSSVQADNLVDFFRAVHLDDARTVQRLLDAGLDPNSLNDKGQPGLFVAMRDEAPKVAAALLAHPKIVVDLANASNETPLMMAALRGHVALAEQLIARGAAVNRPGWSPLHYAATGPQTRMVELLLQRGAAIEALSPNRSTPLMMAARYGPESSVDLLLARGASLQARNEAGMAAPDFATSAGREHLARRLAASPR